MSDALVRCFGGCSLRSVLRCAAVLMAAGAAISGGSAGAAQLECPTLSSGPVITEANMKGLASASSADVSNEVYDLIYRAQVAKPNISYAQLSDELIAAYCTAVAASKLPVAEQWQRMRRFDRIIQTQLAANIMPANNTILATVPLSPAVFDALRSQAASAGKTPAELMAAILSAASGR